MPTFLNLPPGAIRPQVMKNYGAAFTVISGLVMAYGIHKSYTFRKNVQLIYILDKQKHFQQNVLINKRYLLSLAEITSINFKDVHADIAQLKSDMN